MRRPRAAAALLAAALVSGCGLPSEEGADRISDDAVPFGLLSSGPPDTATVAPGHRAMSIYFVRHNRLVGVERRIAVEPDPAQALRQLVDGPTASETQAGIGTTTLGTPLSVSRGPGPTTVTVDLGEQIGDVPSQVQVLAFAQIVYTLADLPDVQLVRFTVTGEPVDVLRGDGSLAAGPVSQDDYAEFAP